MTNRKMSRIFVVDDEKLIAETLAIILRQKGFDVESFSHPSDALGAAQTKRPDLLISDVVMPEFSGVDLAIRVREQYPDCAVLLFSGQAVVTDLLDNARAAGYHFTLLSKPVQPLDLLRAIRDLSVTRSAGRSGGQTGDGQIFRSAS